MRVRELLDYLSGVPEDFEIILQKDAEGNGYSPLRGGEEALYVPESAWSGFVYYEYELEEEGVSPDKAQHVIFLYL